MWGAGALSVGAGNADHVAVDSVDSSNDHSTMMLRLYVSASTDALVIPAQTVIVAVVFFAIGFTLGNLTARRMNFTDNARMKLAALITMIWAVSIFGEIVVGSYTTSVFIHGIMGSAVGYLFGVENPLKNR